jgi:hypothetical protein
MTQLYNSGLYVTHARELYGESEFALVLSWVKSWLASDKVQDECRKFASGTRDGGLKDFVINYAMTDTETRQRVYRKDDPLLTLHNTKVQAIVEAAIGPARLLCVDLWHNPPGCNNKDKKWSQSWHRDPEDSQITKVFIYFSDVDESSGPFEYVLSSPWCYFDVCEPGKYPAVEVNESVIHPQLFAKVTGKIGTVAFCQTSGLHKGGHGEKARTMGILSYVPEESQARTLFTVR